MCAPIGKIAGTVGGGLMGGIPGALVVGSLLSKGKKKPQVGMTPEQMRIAGKNLEAENSYKRPF